MTPHSISLECIEITHKSTYQLTSTHQLCMHLFLTLPPVLFLTLPPVRFPTLPPVLFPTLPPFLFLTLPLCYSQHSPLSNIPNTPPCAIPNTPPFPIFLTLPPVHTILQPLTDGMWPIEYCIHQARWAVMDTVPKVLY